MSEQDDTATQVDEAPEVEETERDQDTDGTDSPVEDEQDVAWDPERARKKIAKLNSEAANLRKRVNQAPKAEDVAAKERRLQELEVTNLRYEVGFELGLPKEIAVRLQGASREEMVEDAQKLLELVSPAKTPPTRRPAEALRGGGEPEREPEEQDLSRIAARMFRK